MKRPISKDCSKIGHQSPLHCSLNICFSLKFLFHLRLTPSTFYHPPHTHTHAEVSTCSGVTQPPLLLHKHKPLTHTCTHPHNRENTDVKKPHGEVERPQELQCLDPMASSSVSKPFPPTHTTITPPYQTQRSSPVQEPHGEVQSPEKLQTLVPLASLSGPSLWWISSGRRTSCRTSSASQP